MQQYYLIFIIDIESLKRIKMIEPYDYLKDDFALISNEVEAKYCIFKYGNEIAKKHLPKKYLYLIKD